MVVWNGDTSLKTAQIVKRDKINRLQCDVK